MGGVFCAVTETVNIIGTRPRLVIIQNLNPGTVGFNDLKRTTGLSSRTLSLNLRFLAKHGLVEQTQDGYTLSDTGRSLLPVLARLGEWGLRSELVEQ